METGVTGCSWGEASAAALPMRNAPEVTSRISIPSELVKLGCVCRSWARLTGEAWMAGSLGGADAAATAMGAASGFFTGATAVRTGGARKRSRRGQRLRPCARRCSGGMRSDRSSGRDGRIGGFFQVFIDQVLSLASRQSETFAHVAQSVALVVGHVFAIEAQAGKAQHAAKLVEGILGRLGGGGGDRRRLLGDGSHASGAKPGKFRLDGAQHRCLSEAENAPALEQAAFILLPQLFVADGKYEKFFELLETLGHDLVLQKLIGLGARRRVEQPRPRLGEIGRRFVEPGAQHLREGIARLIFQRQLFLPPDEQLPAVFLDLLGARIRLERKAQPRVVVVGVVIFPVLPPERVIWNGIREAPSRRKKRGTRLYTTLICSKSAVAVSISLSDRPVLRAICTRFCRP